LPADDTPAKLGFCFLDHPPARRMLSLATRAEELGYDSLWVAETRLTRDGVSLMGALAAVTERIRLGTSILNTWTRGPVLMALTFATLHELAPGRLMMGLGSYSEPLAGNQGVQRRKPLTQMREYIEVVRRILAMEEGVTYDGEVVKVNDITLNLTRGTAPEPIDIPIYIGATGPKMIELAATVADGVLFNGFLPTTYVRDAVARISAAAEAAGRPPGAVDLPQLLVVAMTEDGETARGTAHQFVTMYLGGQPHIAEAIGLDPELTARLTELVGSWPPKPGGVEQAMALVGRDIVDSLTVSGTPAECRARLHEWREAGATSTVIGPLTDNPEEICEALAPVVRAAAA
jgi:5,10-methylenetetrahydromethanopterin reductase